MVKQERPPDYDCQQAGLSGISAMPKPKRTLLDRLKHQTESHPIWAWVLFILFLFSLPGGLFNTVEKTYQFYQFVKKEDASDFKISLAIRNSLKNDVDLNTQCTFVLSETFGNATITPNGLGESLALMPDGMKGTNIYHLKSGESKNYWVAFPNNQLTRDFMTLGAASIKFTVIPTTGGFGEGTIAFDKKAIRKNKASVEIRPGSEQSISNP